MALAKVSCLLILCYFTCGYFIMLAFNDNENNDSITNVLGLHILSNQKSSPVPLRRSTINLHHSLSISSLRPMTFRSFSRSDIKTKR